MTDRRRAEDEDSLTGLFTLVVEGLFRVVRGEVALARAEAGRAIGDLGRALALIAVAGIVALVGLNLLAGALVALAVGWGLSPGWAAVTVGGGLLVLALLVLFLGLGHLQRARLAPQRRAESLRRDLAALRDGAGLAPRHEEDRYDE